MYINCLHISGSFLTYEHGLIKILIVFVEIILKYNARSHEHHGIQIPDNPDTHNAVPPVLRHRLNCNRSNTSF